MLRSKVIFILRILALIFVFGFLNEIGCSFVGINGVGNVMAGGVIGSSTSDSVSGGGDGGGTSGSSGEKIGYAWIYYKATGKMSTDFVFAPNDFYSGHGFGNMSIADGTIPASCSETGRGFWVFGLGGKGSTQGGYYAYNTFGTTWQQSHRALGRQPEGGDGFKTFAMTGKYRNDVYSTRTGYYGLRRIVPWRLRGDYMTRDDGLLWHKLWKYSEGVDGPDGKPYVDIYYAEKYGSIETVLEQFKIAYRQAMDGEEYSGTTLPRDLVYFCYWPEMDVKYTMTAQAYDFSNRNEGYLGDDGIGLEDRVSGVVPNGGTATVTMPQYSSNDEWKFICYAAWSNDESRWNCMDYNLTHSEALSGNPVYRALYSRKHSLTLRAYEYEDGVIGNYLGNGVLSSGKVGTGEIADVVDYKFIGETASVAAWSETSKWEYYKESGCAGVRFYQSGIGWVLFSPCSTTRTQTLDGDPVYIIFYRRTRKTLSGIPIDESGNELGTSVYGTYPSHEVKYGDTATIPAKTGTDEPTGWDFANCWKSSKTATSCDLGTGSSYSKSGMTENKTVYFVYERENRTLTAKAYDTSGNYLGSSSVAENKRITDRTVTVRYKSAASVTRSSNDYYYFKGWKIQGYSSSIPYYIATATSGGMYVSGDSAPKEKFNIRELTTNYTVYAIYELKPPVELVGKSVNELGESLAAVSGLGDKRVKSADYMKSASITRGTAIGYTFRGWAESLDNAKNGTFVTRTSGDTYVSGSSTPKETYNVSQLTNESINPVYARYDRDEFAGRARVFEGTSTSGTNSESTGWTEEDSKVTLEIDCPNDGCSVIFDMYVRTEYGSGDIQKVDLYRSENGGSYSKLSTNPVTPFKPSTNNGTAVNRLTGNYSEELKPGESVCYKIDFLPFGEHTNEESVYAEACAKAKEAKFEGMSSVSGAITGTTGWQNTSKTETIFNNCSATEGCTVTFSHSLKKTEGKGSTSYKVVRTSNLTDGSRAVANADVKTGTFSSTGPDVVSTSGNIILYPGMVVCESLSFKPSNKPDASDVSTKICASATGDAQPPDPEDPDVPEDPDPNVPSGDTSLINIKVRNTTVDKFSQFQREVYAKPGDKIVYRATYNPNLQYTYYLKPEQMEIYGNSTVYPQDGQVNKTLTFAELFNSLQASKQEAGEAYDPDWNNDIYVKTKSSSSSYDYPNGDTSRRSQVTDIHEVRSSEVGSSSTGTAYVGYSGNPSVRTTPRMISFTQNGNNNLGTLDKRQKSKEAYARVPYNYVIRIGDEYDGYAPYDLEEEGSLKKDIVFAGEKKDIRFDVGVGKKKNAVTTNSDTEMYATKTISSKVRIVVYVAEGQAPKVQDWKDDLDNLCTYYDTTLTPAQKGSDYWCSQYDNSNQTFNPDGNFEGSKDEIVNSSFYAPDLDAGKKVCVAAAIYPSYSGVDTNYNDKNGSGAWRISNSKCFTVAKRPNLRVVGGGIFSSGLIQTAVAEKKNVYGYGNVDVSPKSNKSTTVFGSWGQHQIVSLGGTKGIASGAATGEFGTTNEEVPESNRTPDENLGGSREGANPSYCLRVPLTIANLPCSNGAAGKDSLSSASTPSDKTKLIARFRDEDGNKEGIDYAKDDNDTLGGLTIESGNTIVREYSGTVTITGNITYTGDYSSIAEVPKMIIYAKNIVISCGVTRIDAVLIAENDVNTCPNEDINSEANSTQLKINGTVITNTLTANRTYGAAKGVNSVVSAEEINYDSTLFLWGMRGAESSNSGKLNITYQHEIAPRQ